MAASRISGMVDALLRTSCREPIPPAKYMQIGLSVMGFSPAARIDQFITIDHERCAIQAAQCCSDERGIEPGSCLLQLAGGSLEVAVSSRTDSLDTDWL